LPLKTIVVPRVTAGAPGNTSKKVPGASGTSKNENSVTAPSLLAPVTREPKGFV